MPRDIWYYKGLRMGRRPIGIVRVNILSLWFTNGRPIDPEHVKVLNETFQEMGCDPDDPYNQIPAGITQKQLYSALRLSNMNPRDLQEPLPNGSPRFLLFSSKQKLCCFRGRHRTEAAKGINSWWTITLFLAYPNGKHMPSHYSP